MAAWLTTMKKWLENSVPGVVLTAAFYAILLMLVLFIFVPALNEGTVGIMVPVSALLTIAVGRILYRRGVL